MEGWQGVSSGRHANNAPPHRSLHRPLLLTGLPQILEDSAAAAATVMNDRYFFGLLSRMREDVQRQTPSEQRAQLLDRLEGIQRAAQAAAAGGQAGA